MSIIEHFNDFFGDYRPSILVGKKEHYRWGILVGKQKDNVQRPTWRKNRLGRRQTQYQGRR